MWFDQTKPTLHLTNNLKGTTFGLRVLRNLRWTVINYPIHWRKFRNRVYLKSNRILWISILNKKDVNVTTASGNGNSLSMLDYQRPLAQILCQISKYQRSFVGYIKKHNLRTKKYYISKKLSCRNFISVSFKLCGTFNPNYTPHFR